MHGQGDMDNFDGIEQQNAPPVGGNSEQFNQRDYTRMTQVVKANIKKIAQNVQDLKRMVGQLGTQQDTHIVRDKLHEKNQKTSDLAKITTTNLKKLKEMIDGLSPPDYQKKLQNEKLTSDFREILNAFQATQTEAAEKEKQYVLKARAASVAYNEGEEDSVQCAQETTQLQQTGLSEQDLNDIIDREQALRKLEEDIMDVNQIFKDLASMVEEQGEKLDSIEANITTTEVKVQKATVELHQASEHKKSSRKKKFICAGIIIVALAIIGLVIGVSVAGKS